mmetsp:Transcript_9557/g.22561  ORF Transcript_9557/g.22561 Transcript_9557/m.22561 type:complete len:431 (-) Transcript_9557:88-1380(-)|eukprot:CAMPEP_0201125280 /NCGR_PEP_ID=MMETSP0850-20130426/20477_1 /ASSEMBLY_ACC=CAM_ASM_000622 /TAXON_ID=183588 /ORGANISM="Pseudo-nitzschia fraudulenta, Strain WWA7" /LENGTH=430 /DNA_ID=CAMNT_0047393211 /DNA_START=229 /DNA_END=1521 /DNA_ORIENTATION=-
MGFFVSKRISRFFTGPASSSLLLLLLLLAQDAVLYNRGNDRHLGSSRRIAFFTDAFSQQPRHLATTPLKQQAGRQNRQRQRQQQQKQHSTTTFTKVVDIATAATTTTIPLGASVPLATTDAGRRSSAKESSSAAAPIFLIESIPRDPSGDAIFKAISNLCIDVFFKELLDPSGKGNVNFLKAWQINYLKNLQAADLERRRTRYGSTNEMFLAYEIKKSNGVSDALTKPLLMDEELKGAYNLDGGAFVEDASDCYVRGELLGFVEITQRPYGLGAVQDTTTGGDESSSSHESEEEMTEAAALAQLSAAFVEQPKRPVLTNLAVSKGARQYGIGSKLLDACEQHVRKDWKMNEIVLEVEDYNTRGLEFYRQRGYEVLFSDPASRRFDIQGLWLNKVRCRREIMRKVFDSPQTTLMKSADSIMRRIRETVSSF